MDWIHIKADRSKLLDEQWLMRIDNATVGSLCEDTPASHRDFFKQPGDFPVWRVTLLDIEGNPYAGHILAFSLDEAQSICERQMKQKGWRI